MWLISSATVALAIPTTVRISLVVLFALAGAGFSLAGAIAFRRAKTTVNPRKPENASSLVVSGVYRITRNPMYVGLLLMLVAWCVLLSAARGNLWSSRLFFIHWHVTHRGRR